MHRVIAPVTGELLAEVPFSTSGDVTAAAAAARRVQREWARTTFAERRRILLRFHDLVLRQHDELLDTIQLETGKARRDAFEEVADAAIVTRYCAYHAWRHLRPTRVPGAFPLTTVARIQHPPAGVVGFISPWNYPLVLTISEAIPALAAGNAVLIKPDQQGILTALLGRRMLEQAGLPRGLVQVVPGSGPELGPALAASVDYLSFTGSTATGRIVARLAADNLVPCSLELGGKNPMLVMADANIPRAVSGAIRGCFSNAGQLCVSFERLYVHESVYDRFTAALVAATRRLRLGGGLNFDADIGSLTSEAQLLKTEAHVADAVANGAKVLAGGKRRPDVGPLFYEPTVLADVTPAMRAYAEETFGPVVALYRFRDTEDAIARANASEFGLSASVWTGDARLASEVATRLTCGMVTVNESYVAGWATAAAPIGGMKMSGYGRRHGPEGLLKFTRSQTVAVQRLMPAARPPWMSERNFASVFATYLKWIRRMPGLR